MNGTLSLRVYDFLRRRKRVVLVTVVIVPIVLLPVVPYSPRCSDKGEPASVGSILLAKKFTRALGQSLDYWVFLILPSTEPFCFRSGHGSLIQMI